MVIRCYWFDKRVAGPRTSVLSPCFVFVKISS
uniref:Uncharacterized protein n=1 Tax=Arundo donax TaxID=35708 RepID=A0A0A9GWA5_ARUDO